MIMASLAKHWTVYVFVCSSYICELDLALKIWCQTQVQLLMWYGSLQFTTRIFSNNGLERQVKSTDMIKNQQASIYDRGSSVKGQKNTLTLQNSLNRLLLTVKATQVWWFLTHTFPILLAVVESWHKMQ